MKKLFFRLALYYKQVSSDEREQIRKDWDYNVEWDYPNPRRLACSVNEQKSCRERIEASLIYDSLENFKIEDINDKLIGLAVIYHSCIEAGLDPKYEFEYIASLSSYKFAKFLRDFIKRSPKDKSLKAFFLKSQRNINHEVEIFPSWTNSQ